MHTNSDYDQIEQILDEVEIDEQKYGAEETKDNNDTNNNNNNTNDDEDDDDDEDGVRRKTRQFWVVLDQKLEQGDLEYIKNLVRTNQLSMDEKSQTNGRTLLMLATYHGSYDLVSMCINLGADIDQEDTYKKTPLKVCQIYH